MTTAPPATVPDNQINDYPSAMAHAAHHAALAISLYDVINNPLVRSGPDQLTARYNEAETHAATASRALARVHDPIATSQEDFQSSQRRAATTLKDTLTKQRRRAAETIGLEDPPDTSNDISTPDLP